MKLGAVNNFRNSIRDEIRLIASEGFDFVDLTLEPVGSYQLDTEDVKKELDDCGIEAVGHTSPFFPIDFPDRKIYEICIEQLKTYVDFFGGIGVKKMNIHPAANMPTHLVGLDDLIEINRFFIGDMREYCKKLNIILMVETILAPFNTPEVFSRLLEGYDDVMLHIDIGHCNVKTERNLLNEFFTEFGKRICHVHVSDNNGEEDQHFTLGKGSINWKEAVEILKKNNYDSTITLEVFPEDRRELIECREFLEKLINEC